MISCKSNNDTRQSAQSIVDKAIEVSGTDAFKHSTVSFTFRNKKYTSQGHCNHYIYSRIFRSADSLIKDYYEPDKSFKRYINDSLVQIADTTAQKYAESINSVHYFVQLPFRLNDKAVNKTYLGLDTIKNKIYHKIAVNFDQVGGGSDFQDKYLYWFGKDDYKLDYLAYSFMVNGGGIRFREAYNERYIDSVRFVDYKNYRPKSENIKLENISKALKNQQLELVSKIENEKIQVKKSKEKC
ncbi:deoxyribose-phosphate aldolase [Flavobacterium sp. CS20]|jgi:hypothetical protein|nr:deoxyribose-phosphate aldolase [Flavobacterium sp. CS20]